MPDMQPLFDEESPAGKPALTEKGRVIGTPEGISEPVMDGDLALIGGAFFVPDPAKVKAGVQIQTASARAWFGDAFQEIAPIKYADDSIHHELITFAPVVGDESEIHLINQQAYQGPGMKGPLSRQNDHPSTANLIANLSSSPGFELASTEEEMLALVGGF